MKKIISMTVIAVVSAFSVIYAGTPIAQEKLPKEAKAFISKYFSTDKVMSVEKEEGRRGTEYEVVFRNGAEVDFKSDGSWKEVKAAKGQAVPDAIIPSAILTFVKTQHRGKIICEISMKRGYYEVELSDGTELKLTKGAKPVTGQGRGQRGNRPRR